MTVTVTYITPLYAGNKITLTCTVTLDPNVDNNETVTTSWSVPSDISGERYLVTAASGSGSTYTGSLTIRSLADRDDGTYTCTGIVTRENELQVTASDSHTLPTIRKLQLIIWLITFYCVFNVGTLHAIVHDTMRQSTSLVVMWGLLSPNKSESILSYNISYSNINNIQCFMNFSVITNITETQYTLSNLQEATEYSITVSGILEYGETNDYLIASTLAAGQHSVIYKQQKMVFISVIHFKFSSICPTHLCQYISCDFHYHNCSLGKSGVHSPQWPPYRLLCEVWGTRGAEYTDYEYIRRKCHYSYNPQSGALNDI